MPPTFKAKTKPAGMQNFGSSVRDRFGSDSTPTVVKNRTPGPGAYEEKRTAIKIKSVSTAGGELQSRRQVLKKNLQHSTNHEHPTSISVFFKVDEDSEYGGEGGVA